MNSILSFDWWQAENIVIPFISLVVCPAIVLTIVALMRKHKIDKETEVMIAAIQNGIKLDQDVLKRKGGKTKKDKFQRGVTLSVLGLVFIIIGFCVMFKIHLQSLLFFVSGGVMLADGLGKVANFLVDRKDGNVPENNTEA